MVIEHKEDLHPQVVIVDEKTRKSVASYSIPVGAHLAVKEGEVVTGGHAARQDPAQGGPRPRTSPVVCRVWPSSSKPASRRMPASIAKIDGEISFGGTVRGKKKVIVTDADSGEQVEHLVPMGRHIIVTDGDRVKSNT